MSSLPFTLNFTGSTYEYINGYYVIKFQNVSSPNTASATGTITFLEIIRNISVICVAGGGGGGGGRKQMSGFGTGGGGGGAGGSGTTRLLGTPGILLNVTVGYGGQQASDGSNSSLSSTSISTGTSTTIISCTPGKGGTTSTTNNGGAGGQGGNCTVGNGGTGGNGGRGADLNSDNSASGQNSWGTFEVPSEISTLVTNRYGGGGGGGKHIRESSGNAGKDGIGGSGFFSSMNGMPATTPGSGGGGATYNWIGNNGFDGSGGSGASGIVIMYFQYPQELSRYNKINNNNIILDAGLAMPIGTIVACVNTTAPSGWALCNGDTYNTTENPILFNLLGSSNLPDLRGAFLRQAGTNVGTYASYSGPSLQNYQLDSFKTHNHTINDPGTHIHDYKTPYQPEGNINASGTARGARQNTTTTQITTNTKISLTIQDNSTDTETSPYCYGVNWIIKLDY